MFENSPSFKTPIIGLHGAAGTGKSEFAAAFRTMKPSVVTLSLADPIKEFLHVVFDIGKENLWGPSNTRDLPLYTLREPKAWHVARMRFDSFAPDWLARLGVQRIVGLADWFEQCEDRCYRSATPMTTRDFCRTLGEEWGRNNDPFIWTRSLARRIDRHLTSNRFGPSPFEAVIVEDIRRDIDAEALVNSWGGALIVLRREVYYEVAARHSSDSDVYSKTISDLAHSTFVQPQHDTWGASRVNFIKRFLTTEMKEKLYRGECKQWERQHGHLNP
jgi:hypothetical protein